MQQYNDLSKIIHREGYIFVICFAVATFLIASFSSTLGILGFIATLWCAFFFRDPKRVVPISDDLILSPADGIVQSISEASPPPELGLGDEDMIKISIFLNVFNVHVNRVPASGKILALHYNPGKFFNASLDKASKYNERQSVLMETIKGTKIIFVQIAGLIARRIVCDLEENTQVKAGDRYGIIRFGSRADIYLPLKTAVLVAVGQTAIGGETILANLALKKFDEPKFKKD